jgi:hypothetical protein
VKWLGAAPDTLLEIRKPVTTAELDTATTIAYETSTTTTTNANTAITTTTTNPAPANTAASATYETTTTPQRIAPPTLISAQSEVELTTPTITTDSSNTVTTVAQKDNEGLLPGGEEEQERGDVEEQGEQGTEQENKAEEAQSEVRDRRPLPTDHTTLDTMVHEPQRFDWARDVDDSLGLCPVIFDNDTAVAPVNCTPAAHITTNPVRTARTSATPVVNPICGDKTVDPDRTAFANTVPADPVPVDPAPVSPINPARTAPADSVSIPIPTRPAPTEPASTNPVTVDPIHTVRTGAVPIDPDPVSPPPTVPVPANSIFNDVAVDPNPDDVTINLTGVALAETNTAPTNPDRTPPKSATSLVVNNETPMLSQFFHTPPKRAVNPVPGDVAIDPVRAALASAIPIDPVDHTHAMSAIAVPADPVSVDPVCITLVDPGHVNPVLVTPTDQNLIIFTTILVNLAFTTFRTSYSLAEWSKSFYSISLVHVRIFTVF